jgi:anhydro-N-acetylmuramic acid kinase
VASELFIGLMSGTSLDGVDAVILERASEQVLIRHTGFEPYPSELRDILLALQHPAQDELHQTALVSNQLARLYAKAVNQVLVSSGIAPQQITAIGCHGQTIRHRPEAGYTLQIGNAALLAELTGITVVSDFRSRDIAAGGQGAPLVPAFHQAVFGATGLNRVILNIGGIANITVLPGTGPVTGFDTGPGNLLMDAWATKHLGKRYDGNGDWAASGTVIESLLQSCLDEPFFDLPPPKSTGRDLFNLVWLASKITDRMTPADVQRTLLELTTVSIADAILKHCDEVDEVYVCGGGAHNAALLNGLRGKLPHASILLTDTLGISADWVEAAAFGWLASQALHRAPGNLPEVTGAKGERILGAVYAS